MEHSVNSKLETIDPGSTEVGVIMTKQPTTVAPSIPLDELTELFQQITFHHIPVLDGEKLVGILSDRDLSKNAHQLKLKTAADIMSRDPITVDPTTSIECASILLLENIISCVPVISDDETLVGILTWKDLLRFFVYHP